MTKSTENSPHDTAWYAGRIDYMSQFMLEERFGTLKRTLAERTRYMTVCTENMFHPQNASALVRTCEAFGLQDIHTVEELCRFRPNVNIVRGTDKWVDLHRHGSTAEAVAALKGRGYRIVATTLHERATTPERFDVGAGPFAIVFGTEHSGVSEAMVEAADEFIKIPMWGFVESLNVSASASILVYMLSSAIRSSGIGWQLAEEERLEILFRWIMGSVRDSRNILAKYKGQGIAAGNAANSTTL